MPLGHLTIEKITKEIDQTLTVKNVVSVLSGIVSHWEEIGSGLHIDRETLNVISVDFGNNSRRLIEVISCWFECEKEPSWPTVIELVHKIEGDAYKLQAVHYCEELRRILDHQSTIDRHSKRLVPNFDSSYEDWWLDRIQFETDPLNQELDRKTDLKDIIPILKEVATKWFNIGIALEIPKSELDIIDKDYSGTIRQLTEMITTWINMVELHTWSTLINTLRELKYYKVADSVSEVAFKKINPKHATVTESIPTINWTQMAANRAIDSVNVASIREQWSDRRSELLGRLRDILGIPSPVSDESLTDNLKSHIRQNENLTQEELKEIVHIVKRIAQEFNEYPAVLTEQVQNLEKDVTDVRKIQGKLHGRKQKLEQCQSDINKEIQRIDEEMQNVYTKSRNNRTRRNKLNSLVIEMSKANTNLERVRTNISDCIKQLDYAASDYRAISDILNSCQSELKTCLKQYEHLRNMSHIDLSFLQTVLLATAIGTGLGAVVGLVEGPVPITVPANAILGGAIGAIAGVGTVVLKQIGLMLLKPREREINRILENCKETFEESKRGIKQIQKKLDEIQDFLNEAEHPY